MEMATIGESDLLLEARGNTDPGSKKEPGAILPLKQAREGYYIPFLIATALVLVAVAVLISTVLSPSLNPDDHAPESAPAIHGARAIALACNATRFPEACIANLTANPSALTAAPQGLTVVAVTVATDAVGITLSQAIALGLNPAIVANATYTGLVDDCKSTLALAQEQLDRSSTTLQNLGPEPGSQFATLQSSISAALTFTGYCGDGLTRVVTIEGAALRARANLTFQVVSNALALVNALAVHGDDLEKWAPTYFLANLRHGSSTSPAPSPAPSRRRLLLSSAEEFLPDWIGPSDRRVLFGDSFTADPNVTVAQDGSGAFTSIQDAVNAAPANSARRFVIHIKAGVYDEIVRVASDRINVMFLGDGINRTVITGNLSVQVPGITTFKSATVGIEGEGFLAKAITFRNTAGAVAQQAVALRISADKAALYQCSVDAYQDSLWTQAFRQFFHSCTILGTVDFVFGNAAAVLQECTLLARRNLPRKHNVYTAQGRSDPGMATGFVIRNSSLRGAPDLDQYNVTFLGRPWKQFSLTVISGCYISALLHPQGWLPWSGDFALETLFYGEYHNTGPGANTADRVNWSTTIADPSPEFRQLRPSEFLDASSWLPSTGIPFTDSW